MANNDRDAGGMKSWTAPITSTIKSDPKYKYEEDKSIAEFAAYIKGTYSEHYAADNNIQSFDVWEARNPDPTDTHVDTALKYLFRYGNKDGYNRKDIMKTMHYCLLILHYHNKFHSKVHTGTVAVTNAVPYSIYSQDPHPGVPCAVPGFKTY